MAKKFAHLAAEIDTDPERRARVDQYRKQLEAEIAAFDLAELRNKQASPK